MKKIVSLAIMLIIIVSSFTFSFNVQAKYYGDYDCKTLKDGTLRIEMYYGDKEKLTIPKKLGGKKVTEIGKGAFERAELLENLTIGGNIKSIGAHAFYCSPLKTIKIEEGLKSISDYTFANSRKLKEITFPKSLKSIGELAFYECSSLKKITFLSKSTKIDNGAFYASGYYDEKTNWGEDKSLYCGKYLLDVDKYCPEDFKIKKGTCVIADAAFDYNKNIKKIVIPSSVNYIGEYAFNDSFLEKVTIENGVKEIGAHAFDDCLFKTITIPPSVKKMGEDAVYGGIDGREFKHLTIKGCYNSAAEKYAKYKGVNFVPLNPKTPKFSVKAGKKSFKVTYKKVKGALGFQVKYKQGKTWKTKLYKTKKTVTKKIKAKKGACKVKIRSYKIDYNRKIYSKWTKIKKVTVK